MKMNKRQKIWTIIWFVGLVIGAPFFDVSRFHLILLGGWVAIGFAGRWLLRDRNRPVSN